MDHYDKVYVTDNRRFDIYYRLRTPRSGVSRQLAGVDRFELVRHYAIALQEAYDYLRDEGWTEPAFGDGTRRIKVLVSGHSPGLIPARDSSEALPTIHLNSELAGTYAPAQVFARARAEATHEVTHVFTEVHLRKKEREIELYWHWFNEATAAYFERKLNPDNIATLNYGHTLNWVNYPSMAPELDYGTSDSTKRLYTYSPWLLMGLTEQTGDEDLIRRAWHEAKQQQLPCEILQSLLKSHGTTLEEAHHRNAVRSYRTRWLDRLAFERYRNRKFDYVVEVSPTLPPSSWECSVTPLACRYYKIRLTQQVQRLRVEIWPKAKSALSHIRASLHGTRYPHKASPLVKGLTPRNGALIYDGPTDCFTGHSLALVVTCADRCIPESGRYLHNSHEYEVKVI